MSFEYMRVGATIFDGYGKDVRVGDKITVLRLRRIADGSGSPIGVGMERSDVSRGTVTHVNITNGYNQRGFESARHRQVWRAWLAC